MGRLGTEFAGDAAASLQVLLADSRVAEAAVAFDADGTLWAGDVGELLLERQVERRQVPADALIRYRELTRVDMVEACAFCVRVLAGLPLSDLQQASQELVASEAHGPLLEPVVSLAKQLGDRGAEVWIVSGSNAWTVEVAAARAGLGEAKVLAVTTPIEGGLLSGVVDLPVPCRGGKVAALRRATRRPLLFAAGNSDYDLELLEHAEVRLAVGPRDRDSQLVNIAKARGWLTMRV